MELKLQKEEIKHIEIDMHGFDIDVKDINAIEKLDAWVREQNLAGSFTKESMADCPVLIDAILGEGAFKMLFNGYENSVAQYELCFTLHKIYKDEFLKEQLEDKEKAEKEGIEQLERMCDTMEKFNKTLNYASQKYGVNNAVAANKRPSHKRRY